MAGLTTAIQLARAGWHVIVLERGEVLRTGGYKIDVRGAALGVLDRLGLADAARAQHLGIHAGSVVTADGHTIAQMGGDAFGGRAGQDIEMERGDLIRLLADAAEQAGATIRTGAVVESATATGRPEVRLAGGEVLSADFVVAADGLRSAVRGAVVDDADVIRDLGYGIAVHATEVALGLRREEMTYVSAGRTALVYDTGRRTRAMYLFERTDSVPPERDAAAAYLRQAYAGQGWRVPELLDGLDADEELYLDAMAQVVAPIWSRSGVVLVGDAAWCASPASGQGTSLALVGGYVLAARVSRTPDGQGLAADERAMRRFVEVNQRLGPANVKRMVLPTEKAVRSTLIALRVMHALPFSEALMRRALRPLHRAATAIDIEAAAGQPPGNW